MILRTLPLNPNAIGKAGSIVPLVLRRTIRMACAPLYVVKSPPRYTSPLPSVGVAMLNTVLLKEGSGLGAPLLLSPLLQAVAIRANATTRLAPHECAIVFMTSPLATGADLRGSPRECLAVYGSYISLVYPSNRRQKRP